MSYREARRILILILILNILVAVLKGIFGLLSGSLSMVSDAIHSSFDSLSNVVGIIATTISMRAPDENHHYGHEKFETLGNSLHRGSSARDILLDSPRSISAFQDECHPGDHSYNRFGHAHNYWCELVCLCV